MADETNVVDKTNVGKTDMEQILIENKLKDQNTQPNAEIDGFIYSYEKLNEFISLHNIDSTQDFLLNNVNFIQQSTILSLLKICQNLINNNNNSNLDNNASNTKRPLMRQSNSNLNNVDNTSNDTYQTNSNVSTAQAHNAIRQCLYILYLLDLSKQFNIEPYQCIKPFFIKINEKEFQEMIENEIDRIKNKLETSTWEEIIDDVLKQYNSEVEEDDRDTESSTSFSSDDSDESIHNDGKHSLAGKRSLDPYKVYKNLPPSLKKCFDVMDLNALGEEISKLPKEEADMYTDQLLHSGLFRLIGENESETSSSSSSSSSASSSPTRSNPIHKNNKEEVDSDSDSKEEESKSEDDTSDETSEEEKNK